MAFSIYILVFDIGLLHGIGKPFLYNFGQMLGLITSLQLKTKNNINTNITINK